VSHEPHTTIPCPSCAVAVPIGYVKCPRCHAVMPSTPRMRRESMRDAVAGGTSVPEPETGGFPWLLAGVCAAAATAAVIWYVTSGGARAAETAATGSSTPTMAAVASNVPSGPTGPGTPGAASGSDEPSGPATPPVDPRPRQRADAIAALNRALAGDRLWATVDEKGDAIVIRSSFCTDPGVVRRVDAAHDQLAGLGFRAVRCLEKAGTPVWQRDL
jgi:hypothetical protein